MDLASFLASYLALSGAHTLTHLSVANETGAPAWFDIEQLGERWERPNNEYTPSQVIEKKVYSHSSANSPGFYETKREVVGGSPIPSLNEAKRNAAGFEGQDLLSKAMDSKEASLANALYKSIYLAGGSRLFGGADIYKGGDIGGIADNSGISKDKVKGLLALSTIADALKGTEFIPKEYGNLSFSTLGQGTPGLVWSKRW